MRTFHWTRKLLGKSINYSVETEENKEGNLILVRVSCLQPKVLFELLGSTPPLIGKQLLNLAIDGMEQIQKHYSFKDLSACFYTERQITLCARFSL